jgi:hypothetical protein
VQPLIMGDCQSVCVCVNSTSGGERSLTTPAYQLALVFLPLGAAVNKIKSATLTLPNVLVFVFDYGRARRALHKEHSPLPR